MIKAIRFVVGEHVKNFKRIMLLSLAHAKKQTAGTTLGIGWSFFKDTMNFGVLIIFRYLMAGNAEVDGMHLLVYLATGLIPWFFINEILNAGVNAIKSNKVLVQGMQFPVVILPTVEVMAIFVKRLFTIPIMFIIVAIFGNIANFNILLFLYYYIATILLMLAYNLFLSTIITLSRDFANLYSSLLRIVFFMTPIIWSFKRIEGYDVLITILRHNPLSYLIMGFRDAFVHGSVPDTYYSIYFWCIVVLLFAFGCLMQYKLRKFYSDYI